MSEDPKPSRQPQRRWLKPTITAVAALALLGGMIASTQVRTTAEAEAADPAKFDAAEFATAAFDDDIEPFVSKNAVDIVELQTAITADPDAAGEEFGSREGPSTAWTFPVSFTGVAGELKGSLLPISVEGFPAEVTLYLQVGPAINGTALRDVTGEITFQQFVNQLAYQNAATEINNRVKELVLADVDVATLPGKTLTVEGAFALGGNAAALQVVPTSIEVG